jgi:hypothetical protein
MTPSVALFLWLILLLGLLRYDPAKDPETSLALWVPVIWIFFTATRLPYLFPSDSAGNRHFDGEVFRLGCFFLEQPYPHGFTFVRVGQRRVV